LLQEVDHPVLIPREDGGYDPRVDFPQLTKAKKSGPAGWNEAVLGLLEP
jgi:mannosyl-3-phosphoglycerate phosphatase